jgi:hypothetical protein
MMNTVLTGKLTLAQFAPTFCGNLRLFAMFTIVCHFSLIRWKHETYYFVDPLSCYFLSSDLGSQVGRAIAQAVGRWLPTAMARVRSRF